MDEEELGATGKKITIANFFESIKKIDKVANDALEASRLNVSKVDVATEEIEKLKKIVTAIQTDIQTLKDNDKIRRDELEDRLVAQQDALQKAEMIQRQKELKGEKGDKGDQGEPGQGEDRKDTPNQGGGGFFSNIGQGIVGAGSIVAASIFNPLAAIMGGNYGGMPINQPRDRVRPPKTNLLETINPFARLGGMFGRKVGEKNEKDKVKEEIKSEIKEELNFKSEKKLKTRFDQDTGKAYVNDQEVDLKKYEEFKRLSPKEQINQGLDFFKEGNKVKEKEGIKTEKKENKLMNFVKQGGVAGFLGRKLFGKKDNKAQEVGATNPENKDESYSESFSYKGRLDPRTLEFIPDEGSLPEGVPIEKAQQDYYKGKISMLEFDFRSDIMQGMTREDAIEAYGPQSNLYRFKENYNKTLEYGGYELDVGKHYDSIKNSMSGKKKEKGQDSSLKGEKRGIKGVIGGVADSLTGGFFNFDKRGNTKLQDFAQGTADTLTGGIFDFDKKGSTKLQRFGQGFVDAVTGNLTDLDRKGGKTVGPTRAVTGIADFLTADMFDLDKRGKMDLFGIRKRMENKKRKEKKGLDKNNPRVQRFNERKDELYNLDSKIPMKTTVSPDGSVSSEGSGTLIGGELFTPGQPLTENQKMRIQLGLSMGNTYSEEIMKSYNMEAIKSEKSIEPVLESSEKDLSKNIYQEIDNTNQAVSQLITQNIAQNGNANDQNTSMQVPANEPQVSDAEIKNAKPNIPFISLLTNKTRKEMSLTSEGSSEIGGYIS
tara:strand:+ start:146 stop:2452 length:2307 start_codon:yes stop_codon:yes gene_type:complete